MANAKTEFAESSIFDYLIPHASQIDVEEALSSSEITRDVEDSALITSIPQRTLLYFGMA
jgi:hypothetical protein